MLKEAQRLANLGVSVIWLEEKSKKPIGNKWQSAPFKDAEDLALQYVEGRNIGVRPGEMSKIDGLYLYVIDTDIRKPEYAEMTRKKLEFMLETDISGFPTVKSGSGGESRHYYLLSDKKFASKVLWHTETWHVGEDGKDHWDAEIELFGTGKQCALPPSVHPSGGRYEWLVPFESAEDIPEVDSDILKSLVEGEEEFLIDNDEPVEGMTTDEAREIGRKLQHHADDHETWRNFGFALEHQFGKKIGWPIFDEWSKKGKGYNAGDNRLQWRNFKQDRKRKITMRTFINLARDVDAEEDISARLAELADEEPEDHEPNIPPRARLLKQLDEEAGVTEKKVKNSKLRGVPEHLLTMPGMGGKMIAHYNACARYDQPQFAVQAVLGLLSCLFGRYYKTDEDNYSTLYLVTLGRTGAGKESIRGFIGKMLELAGGGCLLGPSQFSSEAAVTAELMSNPRNITVIDEFGKILGSNKKSSNVNGTESQTALMQIYGLNDSAFRPKRYSANGKSTKQIKQEQSIRIVRPALALIGLSTPDAFYDAMSQDQVADGFMNRLLVVETAMELDVGRKVAWKRPPENQIEFMEAFVHPRDISVAPASEEGSGEDKPGNYLGEEPGEAPDAEVVMFSQAADKRKDEIDRWIVNRRKELQSARLDGLFARSKEITQRIALIVALSCDHYKVEVEDVNWAWDYVRFYTEKMVDAARERMGSSPIVRVAEHLAELITDSGLKGLTRSDLGRIADFKNLSMSDRNDVMSRLSDLHDIGEHKVKAKGVGRPSMRFILNELIPNKRED